MYPCMSKVYIIIKSTDQIVIQYQCISKVITLILYKLSACTDTYLYYL